MYPPAMCLPKTRIGKLLYWMEQQFLVPIMIVLLFGGPALVMLSCLLMPLLTTIYGVIFFIHWY